MPTHIHIGEEELYKEPEFKFQFCNETKYSKFWYLKHIITGQILSKNNINGNLVPCLFLSNLEAEIFLSHNNFGIRTGNSVLCYNKEEVSFPSGAYLLTLREYV